MQVHMQLTILIVSVLPSIGKSFSIKKFQKSNHQSIISTKWIDFMHTLIFIITVLGLSCYKCMGEDNLCSPGRLGEKVDCKPDVTHCLKTWTGRLRNMIWLINSEFFKKQVICNI